MGAVPGVQPAQLPTPSAHSGKGSGGTSCGVLPGSQSDVPWWQQINDGAGRGSKGKTKKGDASSNGKGKGKSPGIKGGTGSDDKGTRGRAKAPMPRASLARANGKARPKTVRKGRAVQK